MPTLSAATAARVRETNETILARLQASRRHHHRIGMWLARLLRGMY